MTACPPNLKSPDAGRVTDYLREMLKLSPAQLRAVGVQMTTQLSTTVLSGVAEYRVPADQDLIVTSIQGVWRPTLAATEVSLGANYLGLSPSELKIIRTMNASVKIINKDRNLQITDNEDLVLADIMSPMGSPLVFPVEMPLILPATHTIQATVTLADNTASIVGNAARYGVLLTGCLIPKRV